MGHVKKELRRDRRSRGIALIWGVLVIFVMIGIVGLSLDWGKAALNVHQIQNAADAGALAGAQVVKFDQARARDMAVYLAQANFAENKPVTVDRNESNDANGELVLGRWIRQRLEFIATLEGTNAVLMVGRRLGQRDDAPPLALNFGPIFNVQEVKAARGAIAMSIGSTGAGIICLAADPETLPGTQRMDGAGFLMGSSKVDLRGPAGSGIVGDIQVNATSFDHPKYAANVDGVSAKIWAGEMNVVGGVTPDPIDWEPLYGDGIPFSVNPDSLPVKDPLAHLNDTPPDITSMPVQTCPDAAGDQTLTIQPGYYPNGINPEGGTIDMAPGFYVVGGGNRPNQPTGLVFNGGSLVGHGVTIYVTNGGEVDIGAKAYVELFSPGDAIVGGDVNGLNGVVLWQDIENHNEATIIGSANSPIKGTLYFPNCLLNLGGGTSQLGNQVLAGALWVHGDVMLGVGYDGRNTIKAFRSVLVE